MLTAQWWTGIAGITQIIAAILSIIAVRQASFMIDQAEQSRLDALSPAWEFMGSEPSSDPNVSTLTFVNSGIAAARDSAASFHPSNGVTLKHLTANGRTGNGRVVLPDDFVFVTLLLDDKQPVDGTLTLTSKTRAGHSALRFHLRTYYNPNGFLYCDVEPLPRAETQRRFWPFLR